MADLLAEYWLVLALAVTIVLLYFTTAVEVERGAPYLGGWAEGHGIDCTDEGFVFTEPGGHATEVEWSEVLGVRIRTTARGPLVEDAFWELDLAGEAEPLIVPNGALGVEELFDALSRHLPGFDHEAVIDAMTSVEDRTFQVWKRP